MHYEMRKKVVIADDDRDVLDVLSRRCAALGLDVTSASDALSALTKTEKVRPDIVILDVDMPQGNGLSACEMMAGNEHLRQTPVIILTSSSNEETIRRCHQLCAYYVLKCPDVWPRIEPLLIDLLNLTRPTTSASEEGKQASNVDQPQHSADLLDTVFAMLGAEHGNRLDDEESRVESSVASSDSPWVLSIEDDDDFALALSLRLQEFGLRVQRACAGMEGYRRAFLEVPRAIILDYELPEGNGDYVLRRLKESPATKDIPVIVLTGRHEATVARKMWGLGASEFLTKPLDWKRLRAALKVELDLPASAR